MDCLRSDRYISPAHLRDAQESFVRMGRMGHPAEVSRSICESGETTMELCTMLNAELRLIYLSLREIGLASELSMARRAPQCPELDRELLGPSRPFGRAARGLHFCGEHRTDAVRHVRPERSEHRRVALLHWAPQALQ